MSDPREYQATDREIRDLVIQVKQDARDKQEETRTRVREFQDKGQESVE